MKGIVFLYLIILVWVLVSAIMGINYGLNHKSIGIILVNLIGGGISGLICVAIIRELRSINKDVKK